MGSVLWVQAVVFARGGELVVEDALVGDAERGQQFQRGFHHRRRPADVGVGALQVEAGPAQDVGDQAGLAVPVVVARLGKCWHVTEVRQFLLELPQFGVEAEVRFAAGAVVVGRLPVDAALGHRPQQRQDRRHPGPAADEDQVLARVVPEGEHPERAGHPEPVADRDIGVQEPGEQPVGVDLDDELQQPVPRRGVGHGERPGLLGVRDREVQVLAREELQRLVRSVSRTTRWRRSCVTFSFDTTSTVDLLDRQPGLDHLLVVVEQLDREVLVGVGPAQQGEALLLFVIGQREGRVPVVFDVVAVEDERLAGRALPFLAAVHEHDALLGGGAQDRLVLGDVDLDPDRFEPDAVLLCHTCPVGPCVKGPDRAAVT